MTFTEAELKQDWRNLNEDNTNNTLKKELAKKYGIDTKKTAEIQKEILIELKKIRSGKSSLTSEDVIWWGYLNPNVETYKGLKNALEGESNEFVKVLEFFYNRAVEKMNGKIYSWDRYKVTRLNNIRKYINEKENEKDEQLQDLLNTLTEQTNDFKAEYLEMQRFYADGFYETQKEQLVSLKSRVKKLSDNYSKLSDEEYRLWRNLNMAISRNITSMYTKENWIERVVTDAKKIFENDIENIAKKIRERKLNERNIKVNPIDTDRKGIEMYIGDETRGLYARAVLSALDSSYMRPHYRFIITEKEDGTYKRLV